MKELERHARERVPEKNPEHNDLSALCSWHAGGSLFQPGSRPELGSKRLMIFAGFPATTVNGGTFRSTTERAPTTDPRPMQTPGRMQASNPIQTLSSMRIGAAATSTSGCR